MLLHDEWQKFKIGCKEKREIAQRCCDAMVLVARALRKPKLTDFVVILCAFSFINKFYVGLNIVLGFCS